MINIVKDLPDIIRKEIGGFMEALFFSPHLLRGYVRVSVLLPATLKKRRVIMRRRRSCAQEMRKWFE